MESEEPQIEGEEVKSPEELYLESIYDKSQSKEDRAKLIKQKLATDRAKFYELDFFLRNYYYHIIENFCESSDEQIFKELTLDVLRDIKAHKDQE